MRLGARDEEIKGHIFEAVSNKERGHLINKPSIIRPLRPMSQIGG